MGENYGEHLPPHSLRMIARKGDEVVIRAKVNQTTSKYWNGLVVEVTKGPNDVPGINGSTFTVPCECVAEHHPRPRERVEALEEALSSLLAALSPLTVAGKPVHTLDAKLSEAVTRAVTLIGN